MYTNTGTPLTGFGRRYPSFFSPLSIPTHIFATFTTMPVYPRFPIESADARAALLTKMMASRLPFSIFAPPLVPRTPLHRTPPTTPRSLRLQSSPRREATCRKIRRTPSPGWGAFLKDETLRCPPCKILRPPMDERPCLAAALGKQPTPLSLVKEEPRQGDRILDGYEVPCRKARGSCAVDEMLGISEGAVLRAREERCPTLALPLRSSKQQRMDDIPLDCDMPFWQDAPIEGAVQRGYRGLRMDVDSLGFPVQFAAIPAPMEQEDVSNYRCAEAADEMFAMFIDENCME
ncbi:hypothetical protein C8J57DRAFT_1323862 [Mycena rebaudengoi]|nr:hypothetical protein C8J57DRAFT_1323862 [Mycena rebaudengoi]